MCYLSIGGEVFYDGMQEALSNAGNDVFRFNALGHLSFIDWGKEFALNEKGNRILSKIKDFSPDLILSFNAFLPEKLLYDTNCPIFLLDADNPKYFWYHDRVKQNKDKFYYLGFQKKSLDTYKEYFNIDEQQYLYFPAATSLKSKKTRQDKNISFIGNPFITQEYIDPSRNVKYLTIMKKIWTLNPSDLFINLDKTKKNLLKDADIEEDDLEFVLDKLDGFHGRSAAGMHRVQFLSQISDLGLTIYGTKSWMESLFYYPDVVICYIPEAVAVTAEENENVYNSSKVSINLSHPQAISSFSWRVVDIMATNSCLVMEKKPDWEDLFGKYISKEVKEAILYNDRYDCREKIKNLLSNEKLRLKCVEECQHAIEKNGRWEYRFRDLESFIGIDLTSKKEKGTVISIVDEACYTQNFKDRKIPKLVRFFRLRRHFLEVFVKSTLGFLGYRKIVPSMKKSLEKVDKYR